MASSSYEKWTLTLLIVLASVFALVVFPQGSSAQGAVTCSSFKNCSACVYECAWCESENANGNMTLGSCIATNATCPTKKYVATCLVSKTNVGLAVGLTIVCLIIAIPLGIFLWHRREKLLRMEWRYGERKSFQKMMDNLSHKYGGYQETLLEKDRQKTSRVGGGNGGNGSAMNGGGGGGGRPYSYA